MQSRWARPRRWSLALPLLLAAAMAPAIAPARAQEGAFPSRPAQLVVPYPPGGVVDPVARLLAPRLSKRFGQAVVVENRSGAGGSIGASHVARARPDGYTALIHTGSGMVIQQIANRNAGYDLRTDFAPVALVAAAPYVISVANGVPARTLPELVALARARPGALFYGSAGIGSSPHLITELFNRSAGIEMRHVPYRGNGPLVNALVAGQEIQVGLDTIPGSKALAEAGRLRVLAVTGPRRNPALPDLPTVAEQGFPGFEATLWLGIYLPRNTPEPIVAQWHEAVAAAFAEEAMRGRLADLGFDVEVTTPDGLRARLLAELATWEKVIREAGVVFE